MDDLDFRYDHYQNQKRKKNEQKKENRKKTKIENQNEQNINEIFPDTEINENNHSPNSESEYQPDQFEEPYDI